MHFSRSAFVAVLFLLTPVPASCDEQVRDVQEALAVLGLDVGPADGGWGPRTEAALSQFLDHRGVSFDGQLTPEIHAEVVGQVDIEFPEAPGFELHIVGGRFPSQDSYERSTTDPTEFTIRLRLGDYDPVDYREAIDAFDSTDGLNFQKQRAELASQGLPFGTTMTVDFEFLVSDVSAGTFFQIGRGNGAMIFSAYPDALRFNAGPMINRAILRDDWLGEWHSARVVFHPARGADNWVRIYIDGEERFTTPRGIPDFPFDEDRGASVHFGLYRGGSGNEAFARYRNISLREGDMGPP